MCKMVISRTTRNRDPGSLLTNDLQAAIRVELANVPGAEPPLPILIHKEVLLVLGITLVIAHCYIGTPNQNLPSGVGLVRVVVPG